MQTPPRLISQVAAESGVGPTSIKLGMYLRGLAARGATLKYAAEVTKRKPETLRRLCRKFIIDFADYRPFAKMEAETGHRPSPVANLGEL
jgi:hypothetical protein